MTQTPALDVAALLEELLASTERITIPATADERTIYHDPRAYDHFGGTVLNPSNDYTYEWTSSLLPSIAHYLRAHPDTTNLDHYRNDLPATIESLVDVYTSDLTRWLHHHQDHMTYLTDTLHDTCPTSAFHALAHAQYTAITDTAAALCDAIDTLLQR